MHATTAISQRTRAYSLGEVAAGIRGEVVGSPASVLISSVTSDSRNVGENALFVAISGTHADGAQFLADAIANNAVAVCVAAGHLDQLPADVPAIVVSDPRQALALAAAMLEGHPETSLQLVGITGTLGKTSTALLLEAAIGARDSQTNVGVIGSLGAHVSGPAAESARAAELPDLDGLTTPDAATLFRTMRAMVDLDVRTTVMEVTSHALAQHRTEGLRFDLGIVTNLVPDEHLEYHGTPEAYLATKAKFFDALADGAPVIINADDALVCEMAASKTRDRPRPVIRVSLGELTAQLGTKACTEPCDVVVRPVMSDAGGSTFTLSLLRPLPVLGGTDAETIGPLEISIVLPVIGVHQVANAALAATAALMIGTRAHTITESLVELEPIARRMVVVREASPIVIDDTTGNPQTLRAVFASVSEIHRTCLRVIFGVRGMRGAAINRKLAVTLGRLLRAETRRTPVHLLVTSCDDSANERNRAQPEECRVIREALDEAGVPYEFVPTVEVAVRRIAPVAGRDDLVLLLGAQGMDGASSLLVEQLDARQW